MALVHGLTGIDTIQVLCNNQQTTLFRRSACCKTLTAAATASVNTVTAPSAGIEKLSAAIPLGLDKRHGTNQTLTANIAHQDLVNPAGCSLLAAVAGAAAVATATADLQTEALLVPYAQDRSGVTFARAARAAISDGLSSGTILQRKQQRQQLSAKASRQLTRLITSCCSWQDLQLIYSQHVDNMNVIHVSAMLSKLGKLLRAQDSAANGAAADPQLHQFLQRLEQTATRLLSDVQLSPAAMTVMRSIGGPVLLQQEVAMQQSVITTVAAAAAVAQPQQLSSIAWGFAAASYQPSRSWWSAYYRLSTPLLPTYSAHELATAIWAAAKLQQHPPTAWMRGFAAASAAVLESGLVKPQEMCMMLWGLVGLGVQGNSTEWWSCLQKAVQQQLDGLKPRDVAQVLWAHARLQVQPPAAWLTRVLAAASQQQQLHRATGRDAAMMLWALAAMHQQQQGMRSSSVAAMQQRHSQQQQQQQQQHALLEGLLRTLQMSNCKLAACVPQDYAHILWAVAVLSRYNSNQQQQQQYAHATGSSHHNVAYIMYNSTSSSASKQQQATCIVGNRVTEGVRHSSSKFINSSSCHTVPLPLLQSWCRTTWQYTQPAAASLDPIDAAQLLWAATQLDQICWPDPRWMSDYWNTSRRHLSRYNAQAITVAMWAGYKLRCQPPAVWLLAAVPVLQQQLADLQPAAVCQLLYVLAKLQHRPRPAFMEQLLTRLQLDAHQLQPRAFACVIWSMGKLCYQPGNTWWSVITHHLSERVGDLSEREMTNVVWGMMKLDRRVPEAVMQHLQQQQQAVAHAALLGVLTVKTTSPLIC